MASASSSRTADGPTVDAAMFAARAIRRALFLPLLLMAVFAAAVALQVSRLRSSMVGVEHVNHAMVLELEGHRLIVDAVSGLRGYLLTSNRSFLEQAERAEAELTPVLAELQGEVKHVAAADAAARDMRKGAEQWFTFEEGAVAVHEAGGDDVKEQLAGKTLVDDIAARERANTEKLYRERAAREMRERVSVQETLLAVAGLALILGAGIALYVRRDLVAVAGAYAGALAETTRAREQAEEASRVKDGFLRTVSHELRTPLHVILGWTALLRRRADPETLQHAVDIIDRNVRAQARVVDDMLDVSLIVSGELRLHVGLTDLMPALDGAIDSLRAAAEAKGVALRADVDPAARSLCADPRRLQQILWNLIDNAVKFTPSGGHVHVQAGRAGDDVEIRVSDTGPGVPPSMQGHLFERFRQGDATTTRTHGGVGMGLAIVKHLVELHGGTVLLESPGEEGGATFVVKLPSSAGLGGVSGAGVSSTPQSSVCPEASADAPFSGVFRPRPTLPKA